tara:strand:- start:2300 stop:2545 length:246 start_codon:yes stop_codon:yes gene_type:complete
MILKEVNIVSTSKNLKKIFSDRLLAIDNDKVNNQSAERTARHMRKRLWEEFDQIWVKYNNNQANYQQWDHALEKWLRSEEL